MILCPFFLYALPVPVTKSDPSCCCHSLDLYNILPTAAYGPVFKEERRMYHAHLSKELSRTLYRPDIEVEACEYVLRAIQTGSNTPRDYDMFVHSMQKLSMMWNKLTGSSYG